MNSEDGIPAGDGRTGFIRFYDLVEDVFEGPVIWFRGKLNCLVY